MRRFKAFAARVAQALGECEFQDRLLVFQTLRLPEILRVCEEVERRSKRVLEAGRRALGRSHLFADHELLFFQPAHPFLDGRDHAGHRGVEDTVQILPHLRFDLRKLRLQRLALILGLPLAMHPEIGEHLAGDAEQGFAGRHLLQQHLELALDPVAPDRLAIALAAAFRAEIIGMQTVRAFRPAGGQRRSAIGAFDMAAQGKILVQVPAARGIDAAVEPVLNTFVGLEADQPLVLRRVQGNVPYLRFQIARIDRLGQHVADALMPHDAPAVLRKERRSLQEAHDLGLRPEPPGGEAFERLLHHRGDRLFAKQHTAAPGHPAVAVAHGGMMHEIAIHHPGLHPVPRLFAVLLALMLRDAGEQVLDQQRSESSPNSMDGLSSIPPGPGDGGAQFQMRGKAARKPRDIVDDDDKTLGTVLAQESQHRLHPGPVAELARHIVAEDLDHLMALDPGKLAAAGFLRIEAIAFDGLPGGGDAAIDDGLFAGGVIHGGLCPFRIAGLL